MTAVWTLGPRPVPRPLLRAFWAIHRTIYRASDGRLGLQRPVAGQTFGMMRLTTIGWRTGRTRLAIVGYYEDGPNLVTLAVNGWAKSDPAWWVNLQAVPEAVVELPDGARFVSARAGTPAEVDRLWAAFAGYPGWGGDVDRPAAHRDHRPEIVVLQPRRTQTGAARQDSATAAAPLTASFTAESSRPAARVVRAKPGRRLQNPRLWLFPGLAIAIFGSVEAARTGAGLLPIVLFGIAPHLAFLAGIGQRRVAGQMAPRAAMFFNVLHQPYVPVAMLAVNLAGPLSSPFLYVGTLSWLSHIVIGRAIGDGRRAVVDPLPDQGRERQATPVQSSIGLEETSNA